jgi:hypothetical protein
VIPRLIPGDENSPLKVAAAAPSAARRPLEHLLHALNQPLTGLQCSMEVALAGSRTTEQYVRGLREGLELTERMRALVGAMQEVVDAAEKRGEGKKEDRGAIELKALLQETADDLGPVAEAKSVRITVESLAASPSSFFSSSSPPPYRLLVTGGRRRLTAVAFRFLESVVSLAARGSAVRIETGGGWVRIRWYAGGSRAEFSRPELGMLVAQAGWERLGGEWVRERIESLETVTVRLTGCAQQDCAQPDCAEPDRLEPDCAEPDCAEPDSVKPDCSETGDAK